MTEAQNKLYEKAKQYAKENVKGNCDELKCLAVMLYEFAEEQLIEAKEIIKKFIKYEINEYDGSLEIHFEELKKQAKDFLKE